MVDRLKFLSNANGDHDLARTHRLTGRSWAEPLPPRHRNPRHTRGYYCGFGVTTTIRVHLILSANNRLYTPQLQVNEPPDGPEKRRAHWGTERGGSTTPNPATRARRDAHRRARTHARIRRTRRKCTGQHRRVCAVCVAETHRRLAFIRRAPRVALDSGAQLLRSEVRTRNSSSGGRPARLRRRNHQMKEGSSSGGTGIERGWVREWIDVGKGIHDWERGSSWGGGVGGVGGARGGRRGRGVDVGEGVDVGAVSPTAAAAGAA